MMELMPPERTTNIYKAQCWFDLISCLKFDIQVVRLIRQDKNHEPHRDLRKVDIPVPLYVDSARRV